jgi:diguanylate cyclase (GGDEF)-like protein
VDCALPLAAFFGSYSAITLYNFINVTIEKQRFFAMSITDELTKLYNLRYFKNALKNECRAMEHESGKSFCIIMIDVDDFKRVNDVFGHKVGDLVLKEVAEIIKSNVRSSDIVARYGGEEIVILLRGSSLRTGMVFAEKVRKGIEDRIISDGARSYSLTISLGVASYQAYDNEESIVKRADEGLYKAKNTGKNRVASVEEA